MTNISLNAGSIILDQTVINAFNLSRLAQFNNMYQTCFFEDLVTKHQQNSLTVDRAKSLKEGDLITSTFVNTFSHSKPESTVFTFVTTTVDKVIKTDHVGLPDEPTLKCWVVEGKKTVISAKEVERSDS